MAISTVADSATISTTEYFLASDSTTATYQTADVILQATIDFAAMLAGDQYRIRVYERVDGTNLRTLIDATLSGVQATPYVIPSLILVAGWEVSVIRTAGSDRSIAWRLNTVS